MPSDIINNIKHLMKFRSFDIISLSTLGKWEMRRIFGLSIRDLMIMNIRDFVTISTKETLEREATRIMIIKKIAYTKNVDT